MRGGGAIPALLLGAAAVLAYRALGGGGGKAKTFVDHGMTFFDRSETERVRALLSRSAVVPHPSGVERVWLVRPGTGALEHVKAIQLRGHVAIATPNILDASARERGLGEVTAEEFGSGTLTPGFAVLPILAGTVRD